MAALTFTPKFILQEDGTQIPLADYVKTKMNEQYARKGYVGNLPLGQKNLRTYEVSSTGYPTSKDAITKNMILKEIYDTRIEISDYADTQEVGPKGAATVLKTGMGMNIVIPKGKIKALRYRVHLFDPDEPEGIINAIDGFPNDKLKDITGPKVSIKLALDKAFKFIPVIGEGLGNIAGLSIGPWEFTLGQMKKIQIDFSEPGNDPEWFFQGDGIEHQLKVELSIEKPATTKKIDAKVTAMWDLKTDMLGLFHNLSDQEKTIHIWKP